MCTDLALGLYAADALSRDVSPGGSWRWPVPTVRQASARLSSVRGRRGSRTRRCCRTPLQSAELAPALMQHIRSPWSSLFASDQPA